MWNIIWIVIGVIALIVEAATYGLVSLWFFFGAIVGFIAACFGWAGWLQCLLFLITSAVGIVLYRILWAKKIEPNLEPTNLDRLIGQDVFVTEEVNNKKGTGAVKINGQYWTAKAVKDNDIFVIDTRVVITNREGNTVFVDIKEIY